MKRRSFSKSFVRAAPFSMLGGFLGSGFLLVFAGGLLLYSGLFPVGVSQVRTFFVDLIMPVVATISTPIQDGANFIRDVSGLARLQAENIRLAEENAQLKEWYHSAMRLQAENKALKDLLNVKVDPAARYITARVLSDSGTNFVKSLLISAGTSDGVEKGQAVISAQGLVGRIIESGQNSARILLVNDINARVPVLIENTGQHAIMTGQNTQSPILIYSATGSAISDGARIITSGHGGMFPKGLPVGRVVMGDDGRYQVALFADFNRLMNVRVIDQGDGNLLKRTVLAP